MSDSRHMVQWDEIEVAAREIFRVWVGGGELEWAKECWKHLSAKDLTGNTTVLEITKTYLRLVTLARIYEEFCACAWDENLDRPFHYLAENLEIDSVALGIIAASSDEVTFDDADDDYDLYESALRAATDTMRGEIFDCLSAACGGPMQLYSRMSRTNRASDEDEDDDEDEFDVTGPNMSALEYVTSGFRN